MGKAAILAAQQIQYSIKLWISSIEYGGEKIISLFCIIRVLKFVPTLPIAIWPKIGYHIVTGKDDTNVLRNLKDKVFEQEVFRHKDYPT